MGRGKGRGRSEGRIGGGGGGNGGGMGESDVVESYKHIMALGYDSSPSPDRTICLRNMKESGIVACFDLSNKKGAVAAADSQHRDTKR